MSIHTEEPIEVGWYAYTGGAENMVFHLRQTGQWSAHFANGTATDCAWGYIEQALGVWDLARIDLATHPAPTSTTQGAARVAPDAAAGEGDDRG